MLVEGDERAEHGGGQLLSQDGGGRAVSRHDLVRHDGLVYAFGRDFFCGLAKGQHLGLGKEVAHEQVMHGAGAIGGGEVLLRASESDEVRRDEAGALVHELEEGVLAIGARLAPVDFTSGRGGNRGAIAAHGLAIGFHGQLLQVGREAAEVLGVGQHGVGLGAEEVGVPDTEEAHERRDIFLQWRGAEVLVHGVEALEEAHEVHRANGAHEGQADGAIHGVAAADPIPEREHVLGIDAELGYLLRIGGHGDEVLGHGGLVTIELLDEPAARGVRIGQRLLGGKGLGGDDKQGGFCIEAIERGGHIGRVHVGDELGRDASDLIGAQCLGRHGRTKVGATNADVDYLFNGVAGMPQPSAGAQRGGKITHAAQNLVDIGGNVLAVNGQVIFGRDAQRGMQHGAVLGVIDVLAGEHGIAAGLKVGGLGYLNQLLDDVPVDQVLRQIHVQPGGVEGEVAGAVCIGGKKLAEVEVLLVLIYLRELAPLGRCGDIHGGRPFWQLAHWQHVPLPP